MPIMINSIYLCMHQTITITITTLCIHDYIFSDQNMTCLTLARSFCLWSCTLCWRMLPRCLIDYNVNDSGTWEN